VVGYLVTGDSPGDLTCDPDIVPFSDANAAVASAQGGGFGRPLMPTWHLPESLKAAIGR
jgi:hypothetical protein